MATKVEETTKKEEPKEEMKKEEMKKEIKKEEGREAAEETEMKEDAEKTGVDKSRMDTAGKVKEEAEGTVAAKEDKAATDEEGKKAKRNRLRSFYKSICEQVEFYFGDANLSRDRYFKQTIDKSPDGWVELKLLLKFNKIKQKTEDINAVKHALQKSEFLEVDPEKMLVRRKTPFKKPVDSHERTVYVENLPKHVNITWVKQKFSTCGNILYVSIPRFKTTKKPKGFAFVEFDTKEAAAKAVETLNNPEPEKKPGIFPKGNKTLDALRKKTGAEGAAVEQATRERFQGKRGHGGPSGDTSGGAGPSHRKKRRESRESAAAAEEGIEVGERPAGQESSSGGRKKRKESLVEGEAVPAKKRKESLAEGEGIPAKKHRKGRGESEGEEAAARRQEGKQEAEEGAARQGAGQGEQSRKRKKKKEEQEKTAADEEDKVFGEEKGSSPEEEEEGPSPSKRKYRSQSVPNPSGRDSTEEPGPFERQLSDPGKTSAEDEKSKTKYKKKKKKKKKHRHLEEKRAQEGDAATGTKADERAGKGDGDGRSAGGKGDRRNRKSFEQEVVNAAPKILKSAISSDKSGRPQKKVTIKEEPPEELGAKEKENEVASGKPGKRKRKKHNERKIPVHLRVIPMSEWVSLREEYKVKQKAVVHELKEKLREIEKRKTRRDDGKDPQFVANTVVCMEPPGPVSRKQLINAIGEDKIQVAYIEMKADAAKGYIRCKDTDSAEFIVSRSEDLPDYKFRLLQGEEEQAYWARLQEERSKKYDKVSNVKFRKKGRKKLFDKVQKASIAGRERNHIIFDED